MSLKKISRCGHLNNVGIINLDSILSSISANISSANSLRDHHIMPSLPQDLRLVSTAPPTLKTALKNLRLINWGTQRNSNFSKLITTIFSHFTDIEWESLIPKVRNVTGTLEHRWDDVGTDHKVTPGVIYTPSTHFTVNTNHYKPEQLFDPPAENVNVNYQIFSLKFQPIILLGAFMRRKFQVPCTGT